MSSLLSQASLVMIPSGYKEDVVYSAIPTNGNGDLSFTRASNGTRVNSAGLVEVCPWNLASYSEDFANAYWNPNSNTITANTTTAPNGTTTADTFTLTPSSDSSVYQAVNGVSNNYTISVYAKYVSGDKYLYFFSPLNSQGAKVWFDIQNGTVSNQLSGFTGTIENAGNGWYKCSMYQTTASVLDYIQFGISTTNSSRTLSNNSVSYFWGAQVNLGTAKPYFPTTDRLNVPRLTYQNGGGGCPSLLLEKQSTNVVTYSEQFDQWSAASVSVTANNTTSPDGTQNADLITATAGTVHDVYNTFNGTTTNTVSIFVKKGTSQYIYISTSYQATTGDSSTILVDLDNKTLINSSSGNVAFVSGSIVEMGNGWLRVIYTTTAASATGMFIFAGISSTYTFNLSLYGRQVSSTTQTAYFWGAQTEASSYPTSYIPTTSSSATRVADVCYRNSYAGGITSEGTIFADFEYLRTDGGYATPCLIINGSNYIYMFVISNTIRANCTNGGVIQSQIISGTVTPNTRYKVAARFKTNDFSLYVNGALIGTDTSGTMPTFSTSYNTYVGTDSSFTEPVGKLNELVIFPTALTNAELASLTTI